MISLGELIDHGFYPLFAMVYKCFNIYLLLYRVYLEYLQVQVRSGEIWWFWDAELHRRVRCLVMEGDLYTVRLRPYFGTRYIFELAFQFHWFDVNHHPVAEVMHVLLKSGHSASREEAVEKRNVCRSMQNSWYRSIWMPECGLSIFYDQLKPRSNHKLPEYLWTTRNLIYVFSKPLLTAKLYLFIVLD